MDTNFKLYDPVADLVASGPGGSGLPTTGGTMTGNLTMQAPAKVVQSQLPSDPSDVVNITYLNSVIGTGGPFLPLAGGTLTDNLTLTAPAKVVQSQAPVDPSDLVNKQYTDGTFLPLLTGGALGGNLTLTAPAKVVQSQAPVDPSDLVNKQYVDTFKYGSFLFKSTGSINIASGTTVRAFSNGNATVGPDVWSTPDITCTMESGGIVTISNNLAYTTYFKLTYIGCSLSELTNSAGIITAYFQNEDTGQPIGIAKSLKCLPNTIYFVEGKNFSNNAIVMVLKAINANSQFRFSVGLLNNGSNSVIVDGGDAAYMIIDRVV